MKKFWLVGAGAVLVFGMAGCRPELSQSQLSPKEQQWADFIKANYVSWRPPQTFPDTMRPDNSYTPEELAELERMKNPAPLEDTTIIENQVIHEEFTPGETTVSETTDVTAKETPAAPAAGETVTYKVAKGDTLSKIAQKFYGNGRLYQQILDANKDSLQGNPNRLRIGQDLVIPNPTKK